MLELDHIAVVCSDLTIGSDWLATRLGCALVQGGKHPRFGTHNQLLGLAGGLYLEVIAPDPAACVQGPRWFDLDRAPRRPRWGNWICRADDLARDIAGPAVAMARGDLRWQITVPDDGSLPMGGGFPTLIRWQDMAAHPAKALPDSGCRLTRWEVHHPQAAQLRRICPVSDAVVVFTPSQTPHFVAHFDTPNGPVVI